LCASIAKVDEVASRALDVIAESHALLRWCETYLPGPIPPDAKPAIVAGSKPDEHGEDTCANRVLEILRDGGFDCELAPDVTLH